MNDDVDRLIRDARPGNRSRYDPDSPHARELFAEIHAQAYQTDSGVKTLTGRRREKIRRDRSRRPAIGVALVGVFAAVTVGIFVIPMLTPASAVAATPPLLDTAPLSATAPDLLSQYSDLRTASGDVAGENLRMTSWALNTEIGDDNKITSSYVEPTQRETTFLEEGRVRVVVTAGEPFDGAPKGDYPDPGTLIEGTTYDPGGAAYSDWMSEEPPTDPALVSSYLSIALGTETAQAFDYLWAVEDLLVARPVSGEQEAAILSFLSGQSGITVEGSVIDRLSRPGVMFRASDSAGEFDRVLILSPSTGMILDSETLWVGTGRTDIASPSVVSYWLWER